MRKVAGATFVSMDGVMQAPGGPEEDPSGGFELGGWTEPYFDDATGGAMGAVFEEPFDLLLGRRTYEIFAAHWPFIEDDPIADRFNAITKYVVSSSPDLDLSWSKTVLVTGDVAAEIARLKEGDGPTLLVQGSSVLYQTLFAHDLVDELMLLVFPVVLGGGKRLFGDGAIPREFVLNSSLTTPSGVMIGTYHRSGDVKTGSFAMQEPSELEVERREHVAQGAW